MKSVSDKRRIKELQAKISVLTRDTPLKLHLMHIKLLVEVIKLSLKWTGLDNRGYSNALKIEVSEHEISSGRLPEAFDGFRILHISDLHVDGIPELLDVLVEKALSVDFDLCILGGDFRFHNCGNTRSVCDRMKSLVSRIAARGKSIVGILGNHDEYEIGRELEGVGVKMLINDKFRVERNGSEFFICGIDDCHYYASDDLGATLEGVPPDAFKVLVSHSPEIYAKAEKAGVDLCLAGHTHGGQICPLKGVPILIQAKIPRSLATGRWTFGRLIGITNRGVGSSGVPARFNCPPEIVCITLKKEKCLP
jgi:predicted MPP superfamily phosphohydrolase